METIKKRASVLVANERVNTIVALIIRGTSKSRINTLKKEWNIGVRQFRKYMHRANEKLVELAQEKEDLDLERSKALLQYDELYSKCYEAGDYKTCAVIIDKRAAILGLKHFNLNIKGKIDLFTPETIPQTVKARDLAAAYYKELQDIEAGKRN